MHVSSWCHLPHLEHLNSSEWSDLDDIEDVIDNKILSLSKPQSKRRQRKPMYLGSLVSLLSIAFMASRWPVR